jgi:hypothetical protein
LPGPSVRLLKRTFYNSTGQKIYADSNAGCLTEGIQNIGMGACIRATSNSQKTCSVFILSVECVELPESDPTLYFDVDPDPDLMILLKNT